MGCGTTMSHEKFFSTISTKDIPEVSEKTILYKTDVVDYHFPEAGTISEPLFEHNIKYDTLSHYRVTVFGYVVFGQNGPMAPYERIDSVGITRLVIDRMNAPRELYSKKRDEHWNDIPWENCSLPKKILKRIRKDFLIRTKNKRYVINQSDTIRGVTTGYAYRLY